MQFTSPPSKARMWTCTPHELHNSVITYISDRAADRRFKISSTSTEHPHSSKMAFIDDSNAPGPTNSTAALDCTQMDVDDIRVSPGTHGQLQKLCRRCGTWVGVSKN